MQEITVATLRTTTMEMTTVMAMVAVTTEVVTLVVEISVVGIWAEGTFRVLITAADFPLVNLYN
jgi:hypothetical protein